MKSLVTLIIILMMNSIKIIGQPTTQDATGKGTILNHGTYISLDPTKPEVSLGINNLTLKNITETSNFVYGGYLQGKSEEGIVNIFSEGIPAAGAVGRLNLGWRWSNARLPKSAESGVKEIESKLTVEFVDLENDLKDKIRNRIKTSRQNLNPAAEKKMIDAVEAFLNGNNKVLTILGIFKIENGDPAEVQQAKKVFETLLTPVINEGKNDFADLNERIDKLIFADNPDQDPYIEFIPFAFYGLTGSSFKLASGTDTKKLSGNFEDKMLRGYDYGVGFNLRRAFLQLGSTLAFVKTSNFKYIDKVEYTLRTTTTQDDGKAVLVSEKKITAYQGDFQRIKAKEVNVDLIGYAPLSPRDMMVINLYGRFTAGSEDKVRYPNRSDFGLGVYLHKNDGKFLGGLYFQLPDTSGKVTELLEKTAPSRAIKRFQFGLVTRYSITSLLGW
ncbi:hypothetical protein [Dyadobacter sandarakinus]|uniref:DUF5723 domain-containing protein n=1 Tax=Dyadobacter sandarakinus TaxID=2747268 RepID=A0ABX7I6B2_9BACT|nr:hypothetical protein [Dyadobacter sandarakinus]QRR01490.1 hypothetical protein HWI92_11530 [Dyadobacter sandarakinus]